MSLTVRRARLLVAVVAAVALVVIVAANVPPVRDALAVLIVVGLVILFLGIRMIAYRWRLPDDREYELWGGMGETMDQLLARYKRPGANPVRPPDEVQGSRLLPDTEPAYGGHPLGERDPEDPAGP